MIYCLLGRFEVKVKVANQNIWEVWISFWNLCGKFRKGKWVVWNFFLKGMWKSWKGKVRGVEKFDPVETTSSNTIAKFSGNATIVTMKSMSFNWDRIWAHFKIICMHRKPHSNNYLQTFMHYRQPTKLEVLWVSKKESMALHQKKRNFVEDRRK